MENIIVTADSTCDLSDELLQKHNVQLVPLYIQKGDKSYKDRVDIKPCDIFDYFEKEKKLTKTSAPTIGDYIDIFSHHVNEGKTVIHISISKEFSVSYQNAVNASKEFEDKKVFVVDSKNLSIGSGLVVLKCCELIDCKKDASSIVDFLNHSFIPKVETSFIIDTLTYLHKGGRCSSVAKLGANLLKLKPCIEVSDGKMHVGKKYRGNFESSVLNYVSDRLENRDDIDDSVVFIVHTTCSDKLVKSVEKTVQKLYNFKKTIKLVAGCTISNHCGPNTLGIVFCQK